jgi:uncharacterized protein
MTDRSPPRSKARSRAAFVLVAIVLGCAGPAAAVVVAGLVLAAPARATLGAAPTELHAETVAITSPSGAVLRGWFMAGRPGGGAVVLMHGVHDNRLGMVRRARLLSAAGVAVLLFDFQAHGESTGSRITFGHLEALDAGAAVAFVRQRLPAERVGVIGASLGGAAALLGPVPLPVDALVLEAVYPDIGAAIANRVRAVLGPLLGPPVAPPAAWAFQVLLPPILGVAASDLRPIDHIADVTAPVLVAAGTLDNRTTIAETTAMFERAPSPKLLWAVAGAGHVDLEVFAPDEYRTHVLAFLVEQLQRSR